MGAAASASMYFFDINHLELSMLSVVLASVGFWCSYAMYNSFLPVVATEEEQDKLSAKGFSLGYIGSVILLLGNLVAIMVFEMSPRWSFVSVAIWWAGFAQITFSRLHEERKHTQVNAGIFSQGFRELHGVWKELKHTKQLKSYLLAFFVFSMGIQTIMQMASFFGEKEIQLKSDQLIVAILLVQLIAIPGAFVFSFGSRRLGNIPMLQLALLIWAAICFFAFAFVNDVVTFFIAASLIGFIMGGTQSLARSTYSKLIPGRKDTASFFSFYDVTEKVGLIIGLISFGFIEGKFSMRYSILALIVFFLVGFVLMFFVPKNKQEA
jgi:UMF1 family MFS transporter